MKLHPIPLMTGILLFCSTAFSQNDSAFALQLRSGAFIPQRNVFPESVQQLSRTMQKVNGKSFAVIQFKKVPSISQRKVLTAAGIELLDYIPGGAYTVSITRNIDYNLLNIVNARAVFQLRPEQKMHPKMARGVYPSWAIKSPGMIDVWISFPKTLSFEEIKKLLSERNINIISTDYKEFNVIGLNIAIPRINELASYPFVDYLEPAPHDDQMLNYESRNDSRANILNASAGVGGFDLKGEGVTVGVGDNGDVKYHVDFTRRVIDYSTATVAYHGSHVHGTVGGAGILMQEFQGYAPKSTLISQYTSGIIKNSPIYANDFGMVVTNNSYGSVVGDCDYAGSYDFSSRIIDMMAFSQPSLQHVFAVGNDGGLNCPPYPGAFKTVVGGYQTAKNVLDVGASERSGAITSFSSRGPVKDGRLKPEVTADGNFIGSTINSYGYGSSSGTSMASPAVTGGLVLLNQRYKQIFGVYPKSGLMKALICNGANDQGNSGPDYTNGFGRMNLMRSVEMLNNGRFFISNINDGGTNTHNISVPAGTAQLKVMLYWHDPAAAVFASQTLVNDLDLDITSPTNVLPLVLDTVPGNVNNTASTGADHINNIEQVTITNPTIGTHTIRIQGTNIPLSPQEYFVVYDLIPVETRIVYPIGGEGLKPGETVTIQWESYGDPANTFTVEYSTDNGSNWATISGSVAANLRQLSWTVPNVQTEQAKVRVTRNGTGYLNESSIFTILDIPVISLSPIQCEGYFSINWTAVTGATDYELFRLLGNEMVSVGTTTSLTYTFSGLLPDSVYWVSVRARINGGAGRRAVAVNRQPNGGTCGGNISDNDIRMDSIVTPISGRLFTSTALTVSTLVKARIKNLDDADVTSFKMRYYVGGSLVVEDIVGVSITPGTTYTHTFSVPYNFSTAGIYILKVEVENTTAVDPVIINNSITDTIRQLNNDPVLLPFTDNLETATARKYYKARFGVEGIDRYDYTNTFYLGRLSTFISSDLAYSGIKSLMLDLDGWNGTAGNTNFVYGTYNLNGVDASLKDIRLDFQFKIHGDSVSNENNKVWIRGDDTQTWIEAFALYSNKNTQGSFKKTPSLEISDLLISQGQNFSSSFQIRWGQFGRVRISDNDGFHGHNIDDIRIYEAIDDIQLISIDTPVFNSCGLNTTVPIRVTLRNASTNTISNIPVRLVVDGGTPVLETFAGPLGPDASASFTFTATANLAALGTHTILVNVQYATDNFKDNDTATINIINNPVINSFPYVENFENGTGNWYSEGVNNSWEYGIPSSQKINKAASGIKAWKTNLDGGHNNMEASYLYSPCFNLTGMTNPTLSFNIALDLENCGVTYCDGVYLEYSNDGLNWTRLGAPGTGTNWYNKNYSGNVLWSIQNYTRWHVATIALPTGMDWLRLRIVMESDPYVNYEGVGVDDIHIYDNTMGIYTGSTMSSPVKEKISGGTNWVNFTSGGKLIASIQPNNQNMDSVAVQAYINTGSVRNDGQQYYHDRNITIKPVIKGTYADSVTVRFYFKDVETERLINATGCIGCTKPAMATELGVTKYSDPRAETEDGDFTNNVEGRRRFILPANTVKVPFDDGYYAEFRVNNFSEFWLANNGSDQDVVSDINLASFVVTKMANKDVLTEWTTTTEKNIDRFEIQVARGNRDYQLNNFETIGVVLSSGNSTSEKKYSFNDLENNKTDVRYYRLKIVDFNDEITYSDVKPVIFDNELEWKVYPNPSSGRFELVYQISDGEIMSVNLYNINGKLMKQLKPSGNGFVQKVLIDISAPVYASGLYLLKVEKGGNIQQYKLVKQ